MALGSTCVVAGDSFPKFRHQTIDPNLGKVCYAVTLADVDGNGKLDIVAVTENRVLWYANPGWKMRTIIDKQTATDNVCIVAADFDGDGKVDFGLGAGWTKKGTIQWLSRGKSLDDNWHVHSIGEEVWLHRMRVADVLSKGRPQLVISPLRKTKGGGVRLMAFTVPKNPKTDRWMSTVLDQSLDAMHNHWHVDFDGDGVIDTITASKEGVNLIRRSKSGWTKTEISNSGAGEIKVGHLKNGDMLIATIEPMHGTNAVVYTRSKSNPKKWKRHVLDSQLKRGHAVWLADVDGDGSDEIIIGHSDLATDPKIKGPGVYIYDSQDAAGTIWKKHVIDNGGIATEDIVAADLTGDGRIDIVAGGRATHNLKLYINLGSPNE
jgi:hypothetical protein